MTSRRSSPTTARSGSACRGASSAPGTSYRKSWFEAVGYNKFPETWDEYRDAGKKLKAKGQPIGQTLGHSFGDPPTFWYPFLWSLGGMEVEKDGKKVVLDSKATSSRSSTWSRSGKMLRRRRAGLGRFQQQPRLPRRHDQLDVERRLDLSLGQARAR